MYYNTPEISNVDDDDDDDELKTTWKEVSGCNLRAKQTTSS
jgi:hypothetical protein